MSIELRLDRADRVYRPGDLVRGAVLVNGRGSTLAHEGLSVGAEGTASLQLSAKSVGLLEAFYTSIKPVEMLTWTKDLKPAGKARAPPDTPPPPPHRQDYDVTTATGATPTRAGRHPPDPAPCDRSFPRARRRSLSSSPSSQSRVRRSSRHTTESS